MSIHKIRTKVESAFQTLIVNAGTTAKAVYTSFQDHTSTRKLPCVSVVLQSAEEMPQGYGNYKCQVMISAKSSAIKRLLTYADPQGAHSDFVESVFNALKYDDLAAQLTATQSDFFVFDPVKDLGPDPPQTNRRVFIDAITFEIYCAPNDFA